MRKKAEFPVITTRRLSLREMKASDAARLVELLHDEEVARWLFGDLSRVTLKQERGYIKSMRKQFLKGRLVNWLICDKATGTIMGCIGLQPINRTHNSAGVGFFVGRAYWRQGYTPEALSAVLEYAFGTLKLNRVTAGHFAGNEASGRVQQKCGMQYEGTHRKAFLKNGEYHDELMYAITKDDWLAE